MKMLFALASAVLLMGLVPLVLAEPATNEPGKEVAALQQKLLGAWTGREGCSGRYLFRKDGTYELKGLGPTANETAGTWKVRWDALPPTLVLTCKTSESDDEIGKDTELKLQQLDDASLVLLYPDKMVYHYERPKK